MAEVTTIKIGDRHVPQKDCGEVFAASIDYSISATEADNGDTITLLEFQRDGVLVGARFSVSGTLGASATVRGRINDGSSPVNITAATTAGGADVEPLSAPGIFRFNAGDKLELLVGGADISAAADLQVDLLLCHNPIVDASQLTS